MTLGTGPEALADLFLNEWETDRPGRDTPVPPAVHPDDRREEFGVLITHDRGVVEQHQGVHDLIHCYHPEGGPFDISDSGHVEERRTEIVQVDIDLSDRTDQDTGERLSARENMVGGRSEDYGGILGETKYVLETVRRGFAEYDVVRHDGLGGTIQNSNAGFSFNVELVTLARNTADA